VTFDGVKVPPTLPIYLENRADCPAKIRSNIIERLAQARRTWDLLDNRDGAFRHRHVKDARVSQGGMMTLSLSGLKKRSPMAARGLGKHRDTLILDGLRAISDEAAQELGQHFGSLEVDGRRSLTPAFVAATWRSRRRSVARGAGQ